MLLGPVRPRFAWHTLAPVKPTYRGSLTISKRVAGAADILSVCFSLTAYKLKIGRGILFCGRYVSLST